MLSKTINLVASSPLPVTEICKRAGVTPRWFYMLKSGEIKEPSYLKLERLRKAAEAKQ